MVDLIKKIIKNDKLDKKCRKVTTVNKRMYLFNILRKQGLTLHQIGKMFKMHHATIIHGIKRYNELADSFDLLLELDTTAYRQILESESVYKANSFKIDTEEYRVILQNAPKNKYILEKEIFEAETMQELRTIKRKLYNNLY